MKTLVRAAVAAALSVCSAPLFAQSSASADASATTTILQPISVSKVLDLQFGKVVRPANDNANTVTVSAAGVRSISGTGDGALVGTAGQQAQFTVTGEGQAAISVTVPATFAMGGLTVTTISTPPTALGGTAGSQGTATVNVGGSFPVTKTTSTGLYTGTLTVTAAYN